MKNKILIDEINHFNNGVWSTDLPGTGINEPYGQYPCDHWSISPNQFFADVKEQKLDMLRLKINEIIKQINTH